MADIRSLAERAKKSGKRLARLYAKEKDRALLAIADALEEKREQLLSANTLDILNAQQSGMNVAMVDRLRLTPERVDAMAEAVRKITQLENPVGKVLDGYTAPNGLRITRVTVPMGVVGIIYESRPNVTVDCAALCLKAGNACVLRGGTEAIHSNKALVEAMRGALEQIGFDPECIQLVEDTSRETVGEMLRLNGLIDVLIPRGGSGLIRFVVENATIPVIETGVGNCHIYVDDSADLRMAVDIVDNAKTSRPSVCNAVETLLVHEQVAEAYLPMLYDRLRRSDVRLRGCDATVRILGSAVVKATEEDYAAEFGDYILAVRVVPHLQAALEHIDRYSTHHSEAIVTASMENSAAFLDQVDSAAVYVNASTRFTDGGEFGLGAEVGISTQKLHARGPMGLQHLTSYKYIVTGNGQIR